MDTTKLVRDDLAAVWDGDDIVVLNRHFGLLIRYTTDFLEKSLEDYDEKRWGDCTMDIRTLKVGQKLYARIGPRYIYEAIVEDMHGPYWEDMTMPYFERQIHLTNWDESYNHLPRGSYIAFDAAGHEIGSYGLSADGWDSRPADADLIPIEDTVIIEKSKRDGGGFGTFRVMTLEEARALPHHAHIWVLMTSIAQRFKTLDTGVTQSKRFRLATELHYLTEKEILGGLVLVEVEEETK